MKKLPIFLLGLTSLSTVSQELPSQAPKKQILFPYSTELRVQVPQETYDSLHYHFNPPLTLSESLSLEFRSKKKKESDVFYQDIKDFYDNDVYSLYMKLKHPIEFNNPAWKFEMHDYNRAGIRITLDQPKNYTQTTDKDSL